MEKTTEELLDELREVAIVEIVMTDRGVEFKNEEGVTLFVIPFAKGGD